MLKIGALLGCFFFLVVLGLGGYGAWYWIDSQGGLSNIDWGSLAGSPSPSPSASEEPATGELAELAGGWVLTPDQPHFDKDDPNANRLEFQLEKGVLVARVGDKGDQIRLVSRKGTALEGKFVEGKKATPLTGKFDQDRLTLTVGSESVTLVRYSGANQIEPDANPTAEPSKEDSGVEGGPQVDPATTLFSDTGDVDGDGQDETVAVVSEKPNSDPSDSLPRYLVVLKAGGHEVFRTEAFSEPFRPDLDNLADGPQNEAGIHIVPGGGKYPDLRLVFAPASGNFVIFRFDGSTFQVVETGG